MAKKVLLIDPLCYKGHVNYNAGIIRALSLYYDCDIIVNEFFYERLKAKGINDKQFIYVYPNNWNIDVLSQKYNAKIFYHLFFRFYFVRLLIAIFRVRKNYDAVFVTCVDIYTYAFLSWFLGKNIYVVDHGIGSVVENRIYKIAWRITNQRTNIIVLEEFIKQMVVRTLGRRNVYVVKHPLPAGRITADRQDEIRTHNLIFAPSASNNESFLRRLTDYNIPSAVRIVAKSNSFEYDNEIVRVYKNYLSKSEYDSLLRRADYILLPYESSYNFRVSAIMFEALCMGTPVLLMNNNTLSNYGDIFKGSVYLFKDIEDMLGIISSNHNRNNSVENLNVYSDISIANSIKDLLG